MQGNSLPVELHTGSVFRTVVNTIRFLVSQTHPGYWRLRYLFSAVGGTPLSIRTGSRLYGSAASIFAPGQERGPLLHQRPPPLEQIRPSVGRLDGVRIHMGQRQFAHLSRSVGAFRRPVPEA